MLVMLLSSCATNGHAIKKLPQTFIIDTACRWVKPIYISKDDVLTEGTAEQILILNESYIATCGYKG